MLAKIQLEQIIASVWIFYIIISKFGNWQKFYLVILFEINKESDISLYNTVLPFGLIIGLKLKDSKKLPLDPKKITKQ